MSTTPLLYFRQIFIMAVSWYTVNMVLNVCGEYGERDGECDFLIFRQVSCKNCALCECGSLMVGFIERVNKLQPISAPSDVKRYFVSPKESCQICMLACMLGKNREIYFPKLEEKKMKTFSSIATDFLRESGYEVLECKSDEEAIEKAQDLKNGSKKYPVHYSVSDTTGEKAYEEFFTDEEQTDMNRFESLGVVTNRTARPVSEIKYLFDKLDSAFAKTETTKAEVVKILKDFLPNFEHEEKGKNLDGKM